LSRHWPAGPVFDKPACGAGQAPLKPQHHFLWSALMIAILTILVFIGVIGALNLYEFGRFD
jgi:hypothetical protein